MEHGPPRSKCAPCSAQFLSFDPGTICYWRLQHPPHILLCTVDLLMRIILSYTKETSKLLKLRNKIGVSTLNHRLEICICIIIKWGVLFGLRHTQSHTQSNHTAAVAPKSVHSCSNICGFTVLQAS